MLPPPAPIDSISSAWTPSGMSATLSSLVRAAWPSLISATSKLVPPMSTMIRSLAPVCRAIRLPAAGPAAGPECTA